MIKRHTKTRLSLASKPPRIIFLLQGTVSHFLEVIAPKGFRYHINVKTHELIRKQLWVETLDIYRGSYVGSAIL